MDYKEKYEKALVHLKKFVDGDCVCESEILADFPELRESEDERIIRIIHSALYNAKCKLGREEYDKAVAWLERQKEQKSVEWSEEDEKILKEIISDVKFEGYNNDMQADSYRKINWLKSLRPQKQWKPSEEQLKALYDLIPVGEYLSEKEILLYSLYNKLKEL